MVESLTGAWHRICGMASSPPADWPSPLALLVRVNSLTLWRRVKSIRDQSRLLTAVITLFIASYWGLAFWLFYMGLKFVGRFPGLGALLTDRLLFLLFAFLFVLLLLSNLVISYTNLFRNRETSFLLALPISTRTIFQWKFIETALLASWAFIFLIAPLLAAFGLTRGVAWHFYLVTLLLVGLFIILPGLAGSFLAVTVARYLDRRVFQVLALILLAGLLAGAAYWFRPESVSPDATDTRVQVVVDKMLLKTGFADCALLPSYWLSRSVLDWSEGAIWPAAFFVLVLLSHVLFFGMVGLTGMGSLFYSAASTVQSRGSVFARWGWFQARQQRSDKRSHSVGWAERMAAHFTWFNPEVRALVVKDTRTFWRDTTQWAQSVVLFGLLGVYIFNLRHFSLEVNNPFWTHLVSFLNLGACALNLATLTTRFVFPQFSLEGKRLWILGMAPLGMARVVKVKYWLAACTSLAVTLGLMVLSCWMLELSFDRVLLFAMAITIMTFTLTGLAVGLGVLCPNFKEDNPSKIVSGFGGTLCLVLSFLYIVGSVILLALGSSWKPGFAETPHEIHGIHETALPMIQAFGCLAGFFLFSILLGWLPMHAGLKRLKAFEYP